MPQNAIISFVDKRYNESHSFVNGVIKSLIPDCFIESTIVYFGGQRPGLYKASNSEINERVLLPRHSIYRVINFFLCIHCIAQFLLRNKHRECVVFVRNEPIPLFAASLLKYLSNFKLIYQSSFPHEKRQKGKRFDLKKSIARILLKLSSGKVDKITAVSEEGLKRMSEVFRKANRRLVIPLMCDFDNTGNLSYSRTGSNQVFKFVYIGSLARVRELDAVLKAFVRLSSYDLNFTLDIMGGTTKDIQRLKDLDGMEPLLSKKIVNFHGSIKREELISKLGEYDAGLCLIPPKDIYLESSPTKLVEYLWFGLYVVASDGIPAHVRLFNDFENAGIICNFDVESIRAALLYSVVNAEEVREFSSYRRKFAQSNYSYTSIKRSIKDFFAC